MTLVTGTVQDLGYDGMEGTLWARPARFRSDGQVVYAPERKPYTITGGAVSADLAPGPAVLEVQVGSHARGTFEVVIPEEDTTLADLLDTVFVWEPEQISQFVAEREAAQQAAADAEAAAGQAAAAAQQTGQDRAHVDQVRTELDEAFDESTAGNVLPPRLTEAALNATYRTMEFGGFDAIDPDAVAADHAPAPCITPTFDGSGQAVHPGVWYFPDGWCGYRYWMGMTPYPFGNDSVEQPSILASHDGQTWEVPPGVTNPVDQPATGFWPDPDLIFWKGRLYLWWAGARYRSTDDGGVTWSERVTPPGITGSVSPTVVAEGPYIYVWTVLKTTDGSPNQLLRHTAAEMSGPYGDVTQCPFDLPEGRDLWHVQVRKVGTQWAATFTTCTAGTSGADANLHFAVSEDGIDWRVSALPIMSGSPGEWADRMIYRSAIVPLDGRNGNLFWLWYSGLNWSGEWRIGRTTIRSTTGTDGLLRSTDTATFRAGQVTSVTQGNVADSFMLSDTDLAPAGWTNNLANASNRVWDDELDAFTFDTTGNGNINRTFPVSEGQDWTFSLEASFSQAATRLGLTLQYLDGAGAAVGSAVTTQFSGLTSPQRPFLTATAPTGAVSVRVTVAISYSTSVGAVRVMWRHPQMEQASAPTAWVPRVGTVWRAAPGQAADIAQAQTDVGAGKGARVTYGISPQGLPYLPARGSLPANATRVGELVIAEGRLWLSVSTGSGQTHWRGMPTSETVTAPEAQSATSTVNTVGKVAGKQVWISGANARPLWASGGTPTAPWTDGQGTVVYTPA